MRTDFEDICIMEYGKHNHAVDQPSDTPGQWVPRTRVLNVLQLALGYLLLAALIGIVAYLWWSAIVDHGGSDDTAVESPNAN